MDDGTGVGSLGKGRNRPHTERSGHIQEAYIVSPCTTTEGHSWYRVTLLSDVSEIFSIYEAC